VSIADPIPTAGAAGKERDRMMETVKLAIEGGLEN